MAQERGEKHSSEYSAKRTFTATPEPPPARARRGRAGRCCSSSSSIRPRGCTTTSGSNATACSCPGPCPRVRRSIVTKSASPCMSRITRTTTRSFEGVIPAGQYGAGEVIVWDCGVYSPDEGGATWFHDRARAEREVRDGLEKGKLSILLRGEKLKGSFALVRTKEKNQWLLIKHKDRFAATTDVTAQNRSVLSGKTVAELKFLPAQRMPAAQLAPAGKVEPMPAKLAPMLAEIGRRAVPSTRTGCGSPSSTAIACSPSSTETASSCARGAGSSSPASFRGSSRSSRQQARERHDPRRRARRVRRERQAVVRRAAGSRAAEDGARDRGRRPDTPVVFFCFDLLHFAGIDLRKSPYRDRRRYLAQCLLPSPLVQLVHAADDGIALQRRGARQRLRRRDRQAQGKPLRGRPPLAVVAQGQADAERGFRRRRLHARARARARRSARCWSATGTRRQAALRVARRLGLRRAHADAGQGAAGAAAAQDLSVRGNAGAQRADDLGRARSRRRGELPELDRRRSPARAGLPAAARRHRSEDGAARRRLRARRPTAHAERPDRRHRGAARQARRPRSRWRSARTGSGSRISIASTGRPIRRASSPRSPSATCSLSRAGLAVHAAASRRSPADDDPHARRHPRPAFLPEALGAGAAGVRRVDHRVLGAQGRAARLPAVQQPADAAVARAIGDARVPRLAFAREARPRRGVEEHRLRELARVAGGLGAELSRLRAVRPRSVHLFGQGGEGRRARAQHDRLREGQGGRVLAARAPAEHVARADRQDVGQDGTARLRADPAHASTSMPRATCRSSSAGI